MFTFNVPEPFQQDDRDSKCSKLILMALWSVTQPVFYCMPVEHWLDLYVSAAH